MEYFDVSSLVRGAVTSLASLKVVHVITCLGEGGAEGALYRLCTSDVTHAHIVVSLRDAGKYGPLLETHGVPVYCLGMPAGKITFSGLIQLFKLLKSNQPTVVQTWLYHADLVGGVVGRLAGVRRVVWGLRHSNLQVGTVKRATVWVAKISAVLSRLIPSQIVCCSRQASHAHIAIGYASEKMRLIPNGYDLSRLVPNALLGDLVRAEINARNDVPLFGMVARFDIQKDHENLIASLAKLKKTGHKFRCVLVGSGMEHGNINLTAMLKQYDVGDSVSLLGRRNDIDAVMNALDFHVLSSLGEAFPNVLAEAMACGTPCVTTDVGDGAYIVGETGWVVPPKNPEALAAAIAEAIEAHVDNESWVKRQCAARERIQEHFTIDRMVTSYDAVWRDL